MRFTIARQIWNPPLHVPEGRSWGFRVQRTVTFQHGKPVMTLGSDNQWHKKLSITIETSSNLYACMLLKSTATIHKCIANCSFLSIINAANPHWLRWELQQTG